MEGLPIPYDVIYRHICPYLRLNDLRRAMQVSKSWFLALIADGAFEHVKQNILNKLPGLQVVFDRFPWQYRRHLDDFRPSKSKRARRVWIMPTGGTWYTLKRWISPMRSVSELRQLRKRKTNADLHFTLIQQLMICLLQYGNEPLPAVDWDRFVNHILFINGFIYIENMNGGCAMSLDNHRLSAIRRLFTLTPKGPAVFCETVSNNYQDYRYLHDAVIDANKKLRIIISRDFLVHE